MSLNLFDYLHDGQKRVAANLFSGDHEIIVVNCGRLWGKDTLESVALLSLVAQGNQVGVFGHGHADNTKVFGLIKQLDKRKALSYKNSIPYTVTAPASGGRIEFHSYSDFENLRGKNFYDILFVNEASLLSEFAYDTVVEPISTSTKMTVYVGTARPVEWFKGLFFAGQVPNNPDRIWSYRAPSIDNPTVDKRKIERARLRMPPDLFRQEYYCEFITDKGAVFGNVDNLFTLEDFGKPTDINFAGIDFGQRMDYTVLTILNQRGEVIYFDRFNQTFTYDLIAERIAPVLERFQYPITFAEDNGMGAPIAEQIGKLIPINFYPVTMMGKGGKSGLTKSAEIENLVFAINSGMVKAPSHLADLREELRLFTFDQSGQTVKYSAPPGKHDDCVISLALAVSSFLQSPYK